MPRCVRDAEARVDRAKRDAGAADHKRPCSAWKFEALVSKGASLQHLRRKIFELARNSTAFDGIVAYDTPVTAASDRTVLHESRSRTDDSGASAA